MGDYHVAAARQAAEMESVNDVPHWYRFRSGHDHWWMCLVTRAIIDGCVSRSIDTSANADDTVGSCHASGVDARLDRAAGQG